LIRRRALLASLLLLTALAPLAFAAGAARHVVLISIDGLRPEFYLDDAHTAPALRALVKTGSHARTVTPVFPSVTYPGHATIVTGVRPARHGIPFNRIWSPPTTGRWYEEATDLRAPPLWDVARAAGLTTAAVSWPVTLGAKIDWLIPERDYYARSEPLEMLRQATTPGLIERLGLTPSAEMFKNVAQWDQFLASAAAGIIRGMRPNLLLLHLVQIDYFQHRGGLDGSDVKPALARVDAHVAAVTSALREAGIAAQTTVIVTGDHGFQDVRQWVQVNEILARAGLGGCPWSAPDWRATAHVFGGSAAVFVSAAAGADGAASGAGDAAGGAGAAARAEEVLRREARDRFTIVTRRELDALGALPAAAFALEAAPGWAIAGECGKGVETPGRSGTHGFLPSRPSMNTGFIASGAGVRAGVVLERIGLVDVAPTAARLLGLTMTNVEGRVLTEILP
jgi:predicted AlkP superfamily pyrophosphatase or phosphodiesterase